MIYVAIIKRYFDYLKDTYSEDDVFLTDKTQMAELLRHSLCSAFELESSPANKRIERESEKCKKYILHGIAYHRWTRDYKIGVVEACVKSIILAQEKGSKNNVRMPKPL